jgi:hypothetical protein
MDAYVDLMLQNKMENHLDALLDDIVSLARDKFLSEEEQASLQSIILKLLSHFENLQEVLPLVILSSLFPLSTFRLSGNSTQHPNRAVLYFFG